MHMLRLIRICPKFAEANPNIKLDFVNGHFGYFYKFGMLTNGLGIPLSINFLMKISILLFNKSLKRQKNKNMHMIMLH